MSSEADEVVRRIKRGQRVEAVRVSLGLTGEQFGARIGDAASAVGLELVYDKTKLSKLEGGSAKYLPAEDAAVIALLDPEERGVEWLVLGSSAAEARRATRRFAKVDPSKVAAAESSRTAARARTVK